MTGKKVILRKSKMRQPLRGLCKVKFTVCCTVLLQFSKQYSVKCIVQYSLAYNDKCN